MIKRLKKYIYLTLWGKATGNFGTSKGVSEYVRVHERAKKAKPPL